MSSSSPIQRVAQALAERWGGGEAAIRAQLANLLEEARRAWPSIEISDDVFLDHLARVAATNSLLAIDAAQLYLAAACAAHDARALAVFEQRYIAAVPQAISRLRQSSDFAQEVQQVLREKLLVPQGGRPPRIAEYSGRGALGAWVRVAALRTALSLMRRQTPVPMRQPSEPPDQPALSPQPDVRALQERYRPHLKSAVQKALESVGESDRLLLHRHAIEGLTVEQLGAEERVHGSTISRRLARIRQSILDETRRHLLASVHMNESEFTSVVRVLRSDLDVSVKRILGARRG